MDSQDVAYHLLTSGRSLLKDGWIHHDNPQSNIVIKLYKSWDCVGVAQNQHRPVTTWPVHCQSLNPLVAAQDVLTH